MPYTATVRPSYAKLRALNLGAQVAADHELQPGTKYPMVIVGPKDAETEGTLCKDATIGGLAVLYRDYELEEGDTVHLAFEAGVIRLTPPPERVRKAEPSVSQEGEATSRVFGRRKLRHIHVEPYAPGNLSRWVPQTEPDVYMVLGAVAEYTDFRYCCGTSKALLEQLGWDTSDEVAKPDAILIDRRTGEYVIAEFKMRSKQFCENHNPEDVDVLICWIDDEEDRTKLPSEVLGLKALVAQAIEDGSIDL